MAVLKALPIPTTGNADADAALRAHMDEVAYMYDVLGDVGQPRPATVANWYDFVTAQIESEQVLLAELKRDDQYADAEMIDDQEQLLIKLHSLRAALTRAQNEEAYHGAHHA